MDTDHISLHRDDARILAGLALNMMFRWERWLVYAKTPEREQECREKILQFRLLHNHLGGT